MVTTQTEASGRSYTPRLNGRRVKLLISDSDFATIKTGKGKHGEVTDLVSGKRYMWRSTECQIKGCWCDAEILDVESPGGWAAKTKLGGNARVPKGFSTMDPERLRALATAAAKKRWGK